MKIKNLNYLGKGPTNDTKLKEDLPDLQTLIIRSKAFSCAQSSAASCSTSLVRTCAPEKVGKFRTRPHPRKMTCQSLATSKDSSCRWRNAQHYAFGHSVGLVIVLASCLHVLETG